MAEHVQDDVIGASMDEEVDLRASVQHAVLKICQEEDAGSDSYTTPRAVAALAELTYLYATQSLGPDLDAFSSHAGRRTINESDVKLVIRKHPEHLAKLEAYCAEQAVAAAAAVDDNTKIRKKKVPTVNLQSRKRLQGQNVDDQVNHNEDSSEDEDLVQLDSAMEAANRRVAKSAATSFTAEKLMGNSDDEDVTLKPPGSSRKALGKSRPAWYESSSDDEELALAGKEKKKSKPKASPCASRFRLPSSSTPRKADKDLQDDSDSDTEMMGDAPTRSRHTKPVSRVDEIMTNLSDDSLDDTKENCLR
jgi:histone H3/H4